MLDASTRWSFFKKCFDLSQLRELKVMFGKNYKNF